MLAPTGRSDFLCGCISSWFYTFLAFIVRCGHGHGCIFAHQHRATSGRCADLVAVAVRTFPDVYHAGWAHWTPARCSQHRPFHRRRLTHGATSSRVPHVAWPTACPHTLGRSLSPLAFPSRVAPHLCTFDGRPHARVTGESHWTTSRHLLLTLTTGRWTFLRTPDSPDADAALPHCHTRFNTPHTPPDRAPRGSRAARLRYRATTDARLPRTHADTRLLQYTLRLPHPSSLTPLPLYTDGYTTSHHCLVADTPAVVAGRFHGPGPHRTPWFCLPGLQAWTRSPVFCLRTLPPRTLPYAFVVTHITVHGTRGWTHRGTRTAPARDADQTTADTRAHTPRTTSAVSLRCVPRTRLRFAIHASGAPYPLPWFSRTIHARTRPLRVYKPYTVCRAWADGSFLQGYCSTRLDAHAAPLPPVAHASRCGLNACRSRQPATQRCGSGTSCRRTRAHRAVHCCPFRPPNSTHTAEHVHGPFTFLLCHACRDLAHHVPWLAFTFHIAPRRCLCRHLSILSDTRCYMRFLFVLDHATTSATQDHLSRPTLHSLGGWDTPTPP